MLAGCWPDDLGLPHAPLRALLVGDRTMARLALAALACAAVLSSEVSPQPQSPASCRASGRFSWRPGCAVLGASSGSEQKVANSLEFQLMGLAPLTRAACSPHASLPTSHVPRFLPQPRWPSSRRRAWIRAMVLLPASSMAASFPCPRAVFARASRPPRTPSAMSPSRSTRARWIRLEPAPCLR